METPAPVQDMIDALMDVDEDDLTEGEANLIYNLHAAWYGGRGELMRDEKDMLVIIYLRHCM